MSPHQLPSGKSSSGMSLLELLAVMCIMVLLIGLGVPAVSSVLRSGELTQASQVLTDNLALARQMALSMNRQIEVRLYKFIDPQMSGPKSSFVRAMQLFEVPEGSATGANRAGYRAVSKFVRLPGPSVIVDSGNTLSTIVGNATGGGAIPTLHSGSDLGHPLPEVGTTYTAVCFSFMPDGSVNLPPQTKQTKWFLTVHEALQGDGLTTPPANFVTLQIQPSNGNLLTYHP